MSRIHFHWMVYNGDYVHETFIHRKPDGTPLVPLRGKTKELDKWTKLAREDPNNAELLWRVNYDLSLFPILGELEEISMEKKSFKLFTAIQTRRQSMNASTLAISEDNSV